MALRNVRVEGDSILRKKCRVVEVIDDRIKTILDDMAETMYYKDGVGIAAPQIGILKRLVVINVDAENEYKMINPVITSQSGEAIDEEGCLSVPEVRGKVKRPTNVTVEYTDINGEKQVLEGTGLLAVCICHELDHLEGTLFIDKMLQEERE